jgi:magnesium transporter
MTDRSLHRLPRDQRVRRDGQTTQPGAVHCYIRRPTGLHAVGLEEAIAEFVRVKKGRAKDSLLWIDVVCPGAAEEILLRDRLGLHHLAVEDCMRGRQRPKLDRYPGYVFVVVYSAHLNPERDRTALAELHIFVADGWIVTVHDQKLREVSEVISKARVNPAAFPTTVSCAHALIDAVVDGYMPVIDHLGVQVDTIEHRILADEKEDQMPRLLDLRHEVATTRRALSPLLEIIRTLTARDTDVIDETMTPYFQDIMDHVKRETEELDSLRDTLAATLNAYLSVNANKLNHTVRIMAGWSIILMTMAWIAGIYGMNFDIMPELNWRYGYAWALAIMLGAGIGLVIFFRRRGWL